MLNRYSTTKRNALACIGASRCFPAAFLVFNLSIVLTRSFVAVPRTTRKPQPLRQHLRQMPTRALWNKENDLKLQFFNFDDSNPRSSSKPPSDSQSGGFDRDEHVRILNANLLRYTGNDLSAWMGLDFSTRKDGEENFDDFWIHQVHTHMRYALLSHGAVNSLDGPINNYANFATLSTFSFKRSQFLDMPACRMAMPGLDQEELSQLYTALRQHGKQLQQLQEAVTAAASTPDFISSSNNSNIFHGHQGFRCTQDQRRFYIRDAVVRAHLFFRDNEGDEHIQFSHGFRFFLNRFGIVLMRMETFMVRQRYSIEIK